MTNCEVVTAWESSDEDKGQEILLCTCGAYISSTGHPEAFNRFSEHKNFTLKMDIHFVDAIYHADGKTQLMQAEQVNMSQPVWWNGKRCQVYSFSYSGTPDQSFLRIDDLHGHEYELLFNNSASKVINVVRLS